MTWLAWCQCSATTTNGHDNHDWYDEDTNITNTTCGPSSSPLTTTKSSHDDNDDWQCRHSPQASVLTTMTLIMPMQQWPHTVAQWVLITTIVTMRWQQWFHHHWGDPRPKDQEPTHMNSERRGQIGLGSFKRKPKESLNGEPLGAGLQSIYTTIHESCARLSAGLCTVHDIIVELRARLYDIKGGSMHSTRYRSRLL